MTVGGGGKPTPLLLTHIEENGCETDMRCLLTNRHTRANHIHPMKMPINEPLKDQAKELMY